MVAVQCEAYNYNFREGCTALDLGEIVMFRQLLVGGGVSLCNIAIHALVMTRIIWLARATGTGKSAKLGQDHPSLFLIGVMIPTVSVLMFMHILEVAVWAVTYWFVNATPTGSDVLYFAFVNYTT
jgi:hypothetical protein